MNKPETIKFERTKTITLPVLSMEDDQSVVIQFESKIFEGKKIDEAKEAAHLADVLLFQDDGVNLPEPKKMRMIINKVLESEINENVKDYVGKYFEIVRRKVEGKRYRLFDIWEVKIN